MISFTTNSRFYSQHIFVCSLKKLLVLKRTTFGVILFGFQLRNMLIQRLYLLHRVIHIKSVILQKLIGFLILTNTLILIMLIIMKYGLSIFCVE
ncbi:hypothetical protein AGQ53_02810 [Salmonella enterica subsp. enterica]|nr:hypothetical protein AGQ53_02810 [Salmonella enterica subsp. enterica]